VARDADGEAEAPNQAAANEQAERFQGDALDEVIARHLSGIPDEYKAIHGVSVGDVILGALQIPPEKFFRCTNLCTNLCTDFKRWCSDAVRGYPWPRSASSGRPPADALVITDRLDAAFSATRQLAYRIWQTGSSY
jgi:hypothetical protein